MASVSVEFGGEETVFTLSLFRDRTERREDKGVKGKTCLNNKDFFEKNDKINQYILI